MKIKFHLSRKAVLVLTLAATALLLTTGSGFGQVQGPRTPSKNDKCPVCGMFVFKYPDWTAQIVFRDGSVRFFDGVKDMFKYYLNVKRYDPGKSEKDIEALYVTEWYGMQSMEASSAFFVIGSDVYGPMGRELIPLAREADAREFMKDHKGKAVLQFKAITADTIKGLD